MLVAVSPYHITTREAPAMASLLLAERIVTLLPAPFEGGGAAAARKAAGRSPAFLELMKSWEWTTPLWREGVIVSRHEGRDAAADMWTIAQRIGADDGLAVLRPLMRESLWDDEASYLNAVGADLLKGGPDPGVTVPLAAGLDRFAVRHGLMVARAQPVSVVQRAEARLGAPAFAVAVPVLLQASAERLLLAREILAAPLAALRGAFDAPADPPGLAAAAAEYAATFDESLAEISDGLEDDEVRIVAGTVTVSAITLPFDAVLRSSLAAVERLVGLRVKTAETSTLPVHVAEGDGGSFVSLIIKPLGKPARR